MCALIYFCIKCEELVPKKINSSLKAKKKIIIIISFISAIGAETIFPHGQRREKKTGHERGRKEGKKRGNKRECAS